MRKASLTSMAALLVAALTVGCAKRGPSPAETLSPSSNYYDYSANPASAPRAPSLASSKPKKGAASGLTAALTDNPVTRAFGSVMKKGSDLVKPKAKVVPASDPISLNHKSPPPSPELHISMAEMQIKAGNFKSAEDQYALALELSPDHLGALLGMAHLHDRQDQFDIAQKYYLQAATRHPDDASAANDLGLCYARAGRFDESLAALSRAIQLKPGRKLYRNNIATVLTEMGRTDEALQHLTAVHPPAVAHYNLGYLLHDRGQDQEAATHFSQALRADPSMTQAGAWLAQLSGPAQSGIANAGSGPSTAPPPAASATPHDSSAPPVVSHHGPQASPPTAQAPPLQNPQVAGMHAGSSGPSAPAPSATPTYLQPQSSAPPRSQYGPTDDVASNPVAEGPPETRLQMPEHNSGAHHTVAPASPPMPNHIEGYQSSNTPLPLPEVEQDALVGPRY